MSTRLSKVYDPKIIEGQVNKIWLTNHYFHPTASGEDNKQNNYTIVIPPPNVTAPLHLGHALNNTLQDIMIRFHRMQQYNTLWMPGTDHAGIATQTVVEKRILSQENKKRTDFAREEFVRRIQAWKDEYEARIIDQLKAMGCSCDWQRRRFTMDKVCARAVREAFFRLFKDGLIYRGKRLVNWDPATQTVLADDEVEHETVQGHFWYLRYPLVEPTKINGKQIEHVTVATTRPETMLGDTAVAMNPADSSADYLLGKKVRLPIVGRIIPIITDEHVVLADAESEDEKAQFSTGFLKVTPAHDPDDWEIGQKHGLDIINVMAPDGTISDKYGWEDSNSPDAQVLLGMDRFEAREAIVEWFRQENLLEGVREYTHEVGHSYRSHVPIEPYLSDQWYIAVKKPINYLAGKSGEGLINGTDIPKNSLAGLALQPLLDGRLRFIPQRYAKTYQSWLENLRDWPISRQLWWGHRIPIWYAELDFYSYETAWKGASHASPDEFQSQFKNEFNKLSEDAGLGESFTYQFNSNNPAEVYICPLSEKANRLVSEFKDFSKSREAKIRIPEQITPLAMGELPSFSNATEQALKLCFKFDIRQCDEDVLDTWFSSALWPFSTMGWPDDTDELRQFYPGSVLCTAREIITLWVSRMVMMGQYCVGDIPFSDVYIHAMIQDGQGRKMSKSLGNGIDPLVAINSHGADAMRFTLASMTTETQDIRMPVVAMKLPDGRMENTSPKFDTGRNFCNKLWNASRFVLMNLEGIDPDGFDTERMTITDIWILSRLAKVITETTDSLENYKFNGPLAHLYKFFWNDFCDWYLEWIKPRMKNSQQKATAQNVLAFVLDRILRLLHPFVPFITEGIFQKLNEIAPARKLKGLAETEQAEALVIAQWPDGLDSLVDEDAERQISTVQDAIRTIRDIRSNRNIPTKQLKVVSVKSQQKIVDILNKNTELIEQLAGVTGFMAGIAIAKPENAAVAIADATEVYVHDAIDLQAERQRLEKQKQQIEKAAKAIQSKLDNENYVNKAKPEVVKQSRKRLAELLEQLETVKKHLLEL
ncbi:MAG: valine--tRNA ligase [Sedimentisphaerales bacterium]|nr:valine--tRNA ligase [Sedimentisphaerales bacterium]